MSNQEHDFNKVSLMEKVIYLLLLLTPVVGVGIYSFVNYKTNNRKSAHQVFIIPEVYYPFTIAEHIFFIWVIWIN